MKKNLIYLLLISILITSFTRFVLNRDDNINDDLKVEIAPMRENAVELATLYFSDKGKQYLVRENRVIEHTTELPEIIILEELIKGPVNQRNTSLIPQSTKVYSIVTKNDTAYVNISNEFKSDMQFGSNNEVLAIYSIVNSLTELKTIKDVKLVVEGEEEGILQKYMPLNHIYKQNLRIVNNPIQNPIEIVKDYFTFIQNEKYRQAYDLLYHPASENLDYSMYYRYQKEKNIKEYNIHTYEMIIKEDDFRVVTFDYSEINKDGKEIRYNNRNFKLKNYYGEWKIVIESISENFNDS